MKHELDYQNIIRKTERLRHEKRIARIENVASWICVVSIIAAFVVCVLWPILPKGD